jgi:hypothetical protein
MILMFVAVVVSTWVTSRLSPPLSPPLSSPPLSSPPLSSPPLSGGYKHFQDRSVELQIPPLRYASVGMTKGG